MKRLLLFVALTTLTVTVFADHDRVIGKPTPGIRNLQVVESKVACAGAITPETVPSIKEMGFVSIINLRRAEEQCPAGRRICSSHGGRFKLLSHSI